MTLDDWEAFALESHSWDPKGKARAIYLEQNDVLLMPPGLPLVHSVLTLDTCLQEGGMLWDERALLSTLENIFWIAKHRLATNEAYPHQLRDVIDELKMLVSGNLPRFANDLPVDDFIDRFKQSIQKLRSLQCRCTSVCGVRCLCNKDGRRCTLACGKLKRGAQCLKDCGGV